MSGVEVVATCVTAGLLVYLATAFLKPEWFS